MQGIDTSNDQSISRLEWVSFFIKAHMPHRSRARCDTTHACMLMQAKQLENERQEGARTDAMAMPPCTDAMAAHDAGAVVSSETEQEEASLEAELAALDKKHQALQTRQASMSQMTMVELSLPADTAANHSLVSDATPEPPSLELAEAQGSIPPPIAAPNNSLMLHQRAEESVAAVPASVGAMSPERKATVGMLEQIRLNRQRYQASPPKV